MLAKRGWLLLFLGIGAFYLWGLGLLPLVGPDEPRYAEVAREMFARRDLITPTLGGIPWFEKPPLLYWLMSAGYRVLGVSEYAARLGPAVCGLLTAAFIYWIGKSIEEVNEGPGRADVESEQKRDGLGRLSALIWLSSLGAIVFSRGASFDIVVTMTVTGALACFFVWRLRSAHIPARDSQASLPASSRWWLLVGFYLFIGLSLLAKGLIGIVIPFGVIATYLLIRREWPKSFVKSLFWGIPLALAVAAVWFLPMLSRHGWKFIDQFIIQHHFARFVTNKYHHPAPFYFYLMVLVALSLPWTIFLGAAFLNSRRWRWRRGGAVDRCRVFGFCWIVVTVVFFSFSESKLTAYILPVLPAVALLCGERVSCFLLARRGDLVFRLTEVLLIGLGAAGGWYLLRYSTVSSWIIVPAASPLAVAGAIGVLRPRWQRPLLVLIPLAMFITSAIALSRVAPVIARPESVRDLLVAASDRGYGNVPVLQLHTVERTAEFYATGRMVYGKDGEPVWFQGAAQVADAARQGGGLILCFVPIEYEAQLTSYPEARIEVIGNNGRVSLVVLSVR